MYTYINAVREKGFWSGVLPMPNAELISSHIREHYIDLREQEELAEIHDNGHGQVEAVTTKKGERSSCDFVGLCAGVRPRIDFLKNSGIELDRGILVNRLLQTNYKDIYAIGDCAQQREPVGLRKPIEAVWYTGRMMGETVAQTICGKTMEWNPGHWFNSAKFFDIEYQTYGWVFNKPMDGNEHYHWKDPDQQRMITMEYRIISRELVGVNTFGIRLRHEVFDSWLDQARSVDYVIKNLHEAAFDPEFYREPFIQIQKDFAQQNQIAI
jgi:hypothetical protein